MSHKVRDTESPDSSMKLTVRVNDDLRDIASSILCMCTRFSNVHLALDFLLFPVSMVFHLPSFFLSLKVNVTRHTLLLPHLPHLLPLHQSHLPCPLPLFIHTNQAT